jgi:protein TonB
VKELEKHARELLTQVKSTRSVESQPSQTAAATVPDQGKQESAPKTLNTADLVAQSLDMARLEAQISKDNDAYQKRPKRKFIGARTREYRFAAYVESWRQKVEKVGTLNYPEAAKEKKLYGSLRMTVNIKADGTIESIELNQSSGFPVLDDAAKRIVELAAPYAEFPADVRKDTDIISITRTWTFTREDTLSGGAE